MKITPVDSIRIDQKVRVKSFLYFYNHFYSDFIKKCLTNVLVSGGEVMSEFDAWFENLEKDKKSLEEVFQLDFSTEKNKKLFNYIRLCIHGYARDLGIQPDTNSYWNLYFSSPVHECLSVIQRECLCQELVTTKLLLPTRFYYGINKIFVGLFQGKNDDYKTEVDKIEEMILQNIRHAGGRCTLHADGDIDVIRNGDLKLASECVHISYKVNDKTHIITSYIQLDFNQQEFSNYSKGKYGDLFISACTQTLKKYLQFSLIPYIFDEFSEAGYDVRSTPGTIKIPDEINESDDTITI